LIAKVRKVPAAEVPNLSVASQAIVSITSGTVTGAGIIPIGLRTYDGQQQQVLSQVSSRLRLACATSEAKPAQ
jgi:hypothetical protein